jgi:MFS family permease
MVSYVETMIIPGIGAFESFFHQPLSLVSWILTAYLLVGTAFVPIAGKLGDIFGKKRVLVLLLVTYFVAVTVAGFTPNLGDALGMSRPNELYLLIGVRAVQGVGMGLFPLAFAMIGEEFPKQRIPSAQGLVSAMFSVGASIGLIGGAWVTQTYSWQTTYHTLIPIAFVVLLLSILLLRESRVRLDSPMDLGGALILAFALVSFLTGLTQGPSWGWTSVTNHTIGGFPVGVPVLLGTSFALVAGFVLWERHTSHPIVDFRKLAERNILVANVAGLFAGAAMFLMYVGVVARVEYPSFLGGFGLTVLDVGLYSLPCTIVAMIAAPFIGSSIRRYGPKPALVVGSTLFGLGGLLLVFYDTTVLELVLCIIPIVVGVIAVYIAMTNAVVASASPEESGIQQGMNQTFRNLGNSVGPIIASTILASWLTTYTFIEQGFPVTATGPSIHAYQAIFGLVALMGLLSLVISLTFRNFRYDESGQRIDLGARPPTPLPTRPAVLGETGLE